VQVFTPDGKFITQTFINRAGPSPQSAAGLAFSPDAQQQFLYVADYGNSHLLVLDRKSLQVLYQFGQRSEKPGDFQGLHHLAIDSKGNLYTGEVAPGARAQRFVYKGLSDKMPANALTSAQLSSAAPAAGQSPAGSSTQAAEAAGASTASLPNPYRMLPAWPHLGDIKPGAAIGIVPDGQGGVWLQHRSVPGMLKINSSGEITKRIDVTFSSSHGFCQDRDGNLWAADSGPFANAPDVGVKGNQVFKFNQDGKILLTLGKAGVGKAANDTFIQPTACRETPDGNILVADGHWPRPTTMQQDGDRLVWFTRDGKFIKEFGKHGTGPGEFIGPHGLAFDSQGRLFVADRSNNRVQVFDKNMKFVTSWRQWGRPSGIWILKDDTLIVSDSESGFPIGGATDAPEGGGNAVRNPGGKTGIRIGSAKDGSVKYFIPNTRPEGLAADEAGNIFGGLTAGCDASPSGGCLQKFVKN
jgi:sugar lactone lactonase YvrE